MIEIALYQPDIPPNAATIMRMAACLGLRVRLIEPACFTWSACCLQWARRLHLVRFFLEAGRHGLSGPWPGGARCLLVGLPRGDERAAPDPRLDQGRDALYRFHLLPGRHPAHGPRKLRRAARGA